jgi:hypothetical protein
MRETRNEEALELPDREAMTLLSTTPVPALPGAEQGLPMDPAAAGGGAQDTAADHSSDAAALVDADASGTEQGGTTTEDRSDTFTSSDSASAQS